MIATMMAATTSVAAANVLRLSVSHVSLTQSLGLDAGSQHFARKKGVAAKVRVVKRKSLKFPLFHFKHLCTGEFSSPPYQEQPYMEKRDALQVEQGQIFELHFTAFEIECKYDHLTITDGDGTILMEKSCGTILPANITSTTNIINIMFSSYSVQLFLGDDRRSKKLTGWKLSWRSVEPGEQNVSSLSDSLSLSLDDGGLVINA